MSAVKNDRTARLRASDDLPALRRTWVSRMCYSFFRNVAVVIGKVGFGLRADRTEVVPREGAALILANHQSFVDPPFVGCLADHRQLAFLARRGLFTFGPFGWLLKQLNSVPVREDGNDKAAMEAIIAALQRGQAVVMFPEGSRCTDGAMQPFKRGVLLLVRKAKCPVIPAAIEGAHEAWPRSSKLPRPWSCPVHVRYGTPIPYEEIAAMGKDELLPRLEREIDAMRLQLRGEIRARTNGRWPRPGPGDHPFVNQDAAVHAMTATAPD